MRLERRGDSNRDGFVKGVLVSIPRSLLALQGYDDKGVWAHNSALGALLFGGIGAGIDAMRTGWTTAYDAQASPPRRSAGLNVAPGRPEPMKKWSLTRRHRVAVTSNGWTIGLTHHASR